MLLPGIGLSPQYDPGITAEWSTFVGGNVLLVRSLQLSRELLLHAASIHPETQILLPVTATDDLVDVIRRAGAVPRFVNLTGNLEPTLEEDDLQHASLLWEQPILGPTRGEKTSPISRIIDCGHTFPNGSWVSDYREEAVALLFGLHLSKDPRNSGAAILFGTDAVGRRWEATIREVLTNGHEVDPRRATAQLNRLVSLSDLQHRVLFEIWSGIDQTAGLPVPPLDVVLSSPGLSSGIPLRIPELVDPGTFYAYTTREQTPIDWLPLSNPIHHRVLSSRGASSARDAGAELSRWVIVPAGPDHTEEEIMHAVLGVVKTAEYLGIRWIAEPARARWYSDLLMEWYGPSHDAFRPIFHIE